APRRANSIETARPISRPPPVTRATLPSIRKRSMAPPELSAGVRARLERDRERRGEPSRNVSCSFRAWELDLAGVRVVLSMLPPRLTRAGTRRKIPPRDRNANAGRGAARRRGGPTYRL